MIVVTGGIGAGKSTVLKLLREMGAICADADEISREICRKGTPALAEIARHFGSDVLTDDGELNRPALARLVFSNPDYWLCQWEIVYLRASPSFWRSCRSPWHFSRSSWMVPVVSRT